MATQTLKYRVTSGTKRKSEDRFSSKKTAMNTASRWRKQGRKNVQFKKLS